MSMRRRLQKDLAMALNHLPDAMNRWSEAKVRRSH